MPYKDPKKKIENIRKWEKENPEKAKQYQKKARIKFYSKPENREKKALQMKRYKIKNKAIISKKEKVRKYGSEVLTLPDFCSVCNSTNRLCVDHDHKTGKVRGTLCFSCNIVLGHVKDSIELLGSLIDYLKKEI